MGRYQTAVIGQTTCHLRLLVDQDNGTFKRARELTLDRVAHVPKLGRHNLLSIK